jgi:uncharacterized protein (DUF2267 family)
MSTGLSVFDTTLQESNLWLKDISARLSNCERDDAYAGLRAVLHALRDRLQPESAVHLSAQLPMLIRGLFFDGWAPSDKPIRLHSPQEFAAYVQKRLPPRYRFDPLMTAQAVFATAARFVGEGEIEKVKSQLPESLRALWPAAKAA